MAKSFSSTSGDIYVYVSIFSHPVVTVIVIGTVSRPSTARPGPARHGSAWHQAERGGTGRHAPYRTRPWRDEPRRSAVTFRLAALSRAARPQGQGSRGSMETRRENISPILEVNKTALRLDSID